MAEIVVHEEVNERLLVDRTLRPERYRLDRFRQNLQLVIRHEIDTPSNSVLCLGHAPGTVARCV